MMDDRLPLDRSMTQHTVIELPVTPSENPGNHPAAILRSLATNHFIIEFNAMASPCEIQIETNQLSLQQVADLARTAVVETWRIEAKFSRYRQDNILYQINNANGQATVVDTETERLLNYADQCHQLSGGLFDITSGPLRRIWTFSGAPCNPSQLQIDAIVSTVGWSKCRWQPPYLTLPAQGEIDLGGIGKEYAVDRICQQLMATPKVTLAILVNFGGDLACSGPRLNRQPWQVGLQTVDAQQPAGVLALAGGGLATSGDTHRFLTWRGKRLSHILNPKTGWPVFDAPQTVTVMAPSCTLAGMLATFAMLQGPDAERFLAQQEFPHWVQRRKS